MHFHKCIENNIIQKRNGNMLYSDIVHRYFLLTDFYLNFYKNKVDNERIIKSVSSIL